MVLLLYRTPHVSQTVEFMRGWELGGGPIPARKHPLLIAVLPPHPKDMLGPFPLRLRGAGAECRCCSRRGAAVRLCCVGSRRSWELGLWGWNN